MTEQSTNYPEDAPKRLILGFDRSICRALLQWRGENPCACASIHHANVLTDSNDISLDGLQAPAPPDGYPKGFI